MKLTCFAASATILAFLATPTVLADTYTYSGVSGANNWSTGTDWDVTPVSASDTILDFSGILAASEVITSNNDIASPFTLNRLNLDFSGVATPRAQITLSGGTLNFVANGPTNPIFDQRNVGSNNSAPDYIINNNIIATADLTVFADRTTFNGSINTTGSLVLTGSAAQNTNWQLTPTSFIAGDLSVRTNGTSGGARAIRLGAHDQIGGSVNLSASGEGGHNAIFALNGFNQTLDTLTGIYEVNMQNEAFKQQVQNGAATDSTLTIGNNDASSSFLGRLTDGGAGVLNVTKTGTGTQTFLSNSNNTGTTTIDQGGIVVDFSSYATVQSNTGQDFFSPDSDLVMNGGTTFSIVGRTDGVALAESASTQQYANHISVSDSTGLVVGQEILIDNGANPALVRFIVNIDGNRLYTNNRTGGGTRDVVIGATTGSTIQNIQSLILSGSVGENVTIDFGTSNNVQLIVNNSPVQLIDGSILTLSNWAGSISGGGGDQWLFAGDSTEFTSVFNQSEVIFDGYGSGYNIIDGAGTYEVVAIPEPSTFVLLFAFGAALLALRRKLR